VSKDAAQKEVDRLSDDQSMLANVVCHRITQFGASSPQVAEAHEAWRKAWCAWADAFDDWRRGRASLGGGT
jgi:hypothetical protein